jgi:hypothetical protein
MIATDYMKNTRAEHSFNFVTTALFLVLFTLAFFSKDLLIIGVAVILSIIWLFFHLIKPAYKILSENANKQDMRNLILVPMGVGLLRIYWPPYQRMARKLANEEAIRECENALKMMENDFKAGWERFGECFPKIKRGRTSKQKLQLIEKVLRAAINQERIELENGFRVTKEGIKSKFVLENTPLADFLIEEEKGEAINPYSDISQKSFDEQLKSSTSWLMWLQKELDETSSDEIFRRLLDVPAWRMD